jgi:hypothetical protein
MRWGDRGATHAVWLDFRAVFVRYLCGIRAIFVRYTDVLLYTPRGIWPEK